MTIVDDFISLSDVQIQKRIGEKLKRARLRQNITQKKLSEDAAISLSSVKKIESGEINSFDSLLRVLRTLGMIDSLSPLFEDEQMSPSEYYELVNRAGRNLRKRAAKASKSLKNNSKESLSY